jgi:lysophospholipase L1-like esterase
VPARLNDPRQHQKAHSDSGFRRLGPRLVVLLAAVVGLAVIGTAPAATGSDRSGSDRVSNTAKPMIAGTAKVGERLTASPGGWDPCDVSLAYQWFANGTGVGTSSATYTPEPGDVGKTISVRVTASRTDDEPASATSEPTGPVAPGTITNLLPPTVTGNPKVGELLSAAPGTWDPADVSFEYQWLSNENEILAAEQSDYLVRPGDEDAAISVRVTASKTGYVTTSETSDPTGPVQPLDPLDPVDPVEPVAPDGARDPGVRSAGPASARSGDGCVQTQAQALAPRRVGKRERAALCGRVTTPSVGILPLGELRLAIERAGGGYAASKVVRFSGGTQCVHTHRLTKRGRYTLSVQYLPGKRSSFTPSSDAASFTVRGGHHARSTADAQARRRGSLLVLGDSLARIYNDKAGSRRQGFWSMVAHDVRAEPHVVAQGGSGFVKPGLSRCKGRTFLEQLARSSVRQRFTQAGAVIIEGGRNDTQVCTGHGHFADVSTAQLREAVDTFMDDVQSVRGADDCTIVVTPWGPKGVDQRARITPVVRRSAERHGFTFVDTVGLLNERTTIDDGVHPTHDGNVALSRAILDQSFARACFY